MFDTSELEKRIRINIRDLLISILPSSYGYTKEHELLLREKMIRIMELIDKDKEKACEEYLENSCDCCDRIDLENYEPDYADLMSR